MTDRLYFEEGHHKDYAVIRDDNYSLSCYTDNGDVDFYKKTELHECRLIRNVERYSGDAEAAIDHMALSESSEATDSPSQATEADATDDTSQPSTPASNGRAELQKAMLDAGIDVSDVSITRDDTDRVFRIETGADTDKSEGSVWRTWADPIFSDDDGPGDIKWHDDGYPDHFVLPYDALEDVVG